MRRFLVHAIGRVSAFDHCRVPLGWFHWHGRSDPASRLHARALALSHGGKALPRGVLVRAGAAVLHLLRVGRQTLLNVRRWGPGSKRSYGVSLLRQLREIPVAVFRFNLPPALYYKLRLFNLPRSEWGNIFTHAETTLLLVELSRRKGGAARWEKAGWWRFCLEQDLPTVPVLVHASNERLHWGTGSADSLTTGGHDLFLKPDNDYSSRGGVMLEWRQAGDGWQLHGAATDFVPRTTVVDFIRRRSRGTSLVVQKRLRNAASIATLSARALVNVRVMTLREANGSVSVLLAMLRMPPGEQVVSDVVGRTLCVRIDEKTGRMGWIECGQVGHGAQTHHPVTGERIEGTIFEPWSEMKTLALRAHTLVADMPVVGWDLVATDHGVMILEANDVWHGLLGQAWGRQPLGGTAWARLMENHFAQPDPLEPLAQAAVGLAIDPRQALPLPTH